MRFDERSSLSLSLSLCKARGAKYTHSFLAAAQRMIEPSREAKKGATGARGTDAGSIIDGATNCRLTLTDGRRRARACSFISRPALCFCIRKQAAAAVYMCQSGPSILRHLTYDKAPRMTRPSALCSLSLGDVSHRKR
jgi:hypothetical protein